MEMILRLWSMISDWSLHLVTFSFANLTFVQIWASPSPRNSTPVAIKSYPPICPCQSGDPAESASIYWTKRKSSSPTQILPLFSKCSKRPALFSLLLRPEPDGGGRFSRTSARNWTSTDHRWSGREQGRYFPGCWRGRGGGVERRARRPLPLAAAVVAWLRREVFSRWRKAVFASSDDSKLRCSCWALAKKITKNHKKSQKNFKKLNFFFFIKRNKNLKRILKNEEKIEIIINFLSQGKMEKKARKRIGKKKNTRENQKRSMSKSFF